jgi:hypothetical protein
MRIDSSKWPVHPGPRDYDVGDTVEVAWGTLGLLPGVGSVTTTRLTGGIGMILDVQPTRVMIRFVNGSTWWVGRNDLEKKVVNHVKVE